jgi:hypothetical protein
MTNVERILGEITSAKIKRIANDPRLAYYYARDTVGGRFPEGEATLAKSDEWAYWYAMDVIGGRWPEAEPTIRTLPMIAVLYAKNVIKGRWPEAEPHIAESPRSAYTYAVQFGRFLEGEEAVAKSEDYRADYLELFPEAKDDWAMNGWIGWLDT